MLSHPSSQSSSSGFALTYITRHIIHSAQRIIYPFWLCDTGSAQTLVLSSDSPGQRCSLHFRTSSPVPSHCCPVTAAPWHTRARLCQPPSQDLEQPLHGPQGFHWPLAKTELFTVRSCRGRRRGITFETKRIPKLSLSIFWKIVEKFDF